MGGIRRGRAHLGAASLVALGWLLAGQALAQPAKADDGTATFPAAFFAQYNPVTAADMVARTPGFELRDGDDRRGFGGSSGNLLINGERPSSKTAASEILKRIPAGDVVRVEVMSATNASSDVSGQTQVVNLVINRSAARKPSTTFVAGLRQIQYSERIGWTLQASRSMALSDTADLSMDVQTPNILGRGEIRDLLYNNAGDLTGVRYQIGQSTNVSLQGSAHLRWRPNSQDAINLNAQYVPAWNKTDTVQYEAIATTALRSSLVGRTEYDDNYTAEVGGDWEHRFSQALSVKLIGLISQSSVVQQDVYDIFTAPAANLIRTQDRTTSGGERIARGVVKWNGISRHALEFGGEGAFNFRDTTLDIINQPRGGTPVRVPLPVADARVEEVRGEVFVTDMWSASDKLTMEGGVNVEFSRISQTGDQEQEREFNFVKPRLNATYVLTPDHTLRFSLVRDVSQLDFAEFSSTIDFVNSSTIQGNPNLVPEKAWKSRLEWEGRFGKRAAVTLAAFADAVQDVHDLVEIGGFDAYGNIGDGTRVGAEIRGTVPLDQLGLANAELRLNGLYQQTRVTDPITGQKRSFSVPLERQGTASGAPVLNAGNKDWAYVLNFRQNLPAISSAWGVVAVQWAEREEYRRAEIITYVRPEPRIDVFFETTLIKPVTLKLYVNNILSSSEERTRTYFLGSRAGGQIDRVEERLSDGGPEGSRAIGVQVSGRF